MNPTHPTMRLIWLFVRARRGTLHAGLVAVSVVVTATISRMPVPASQEIGQNLAYGYVYYPLLVGPIFVSAMVSRAAWVEPRHSHSAMYMDAGYRLSMAALCILGAVPPAILSAADGAATLAVTNTSVMLILCLSLNCFMSSHWAWLPPLAYGLLGTTVPATSLFLISLVSSPAKLFWSLLLLPLVTLGATRYAHFSAGMKP